MRLWSLRQCFSPLALIVLLFALPNGAAALSEADLQLFPIVDVPAGATVLSAENLIEMTQGVDYTYDLLRTNVANPSNNNPSTSDPLTWTILSYQGTLTYFGEEPDPNEIFLLVFTSLREGPFDGSALPPPIDGGYVLPSFSGLGGDPFYVSDPTPGAVTDEEGDLFLALAFAAAPGPQTFEFDIALREPLNDTLQHFNRGFVVPEPTSFALLGLAIGAMVAGRGSRKR